MKHSNIFPALIFVICFFIAGCISAESPEPTAEIPENTAAAQIGGRPTRTPLPTATVTVTPQPTHTPFPSVTLPPTITPTPTTRPSRTPVLPLVPTSTPLPWPTPYPGDWVSGLIADKANGILEVGASSVGRGDLISHPYITYETPDQATAETIANIEDEALVVLFGTYMENISEGEFAGHMIVRLAQQVHLPFNEETPLTAVYVHPDNLFSFAYPENMPLIIYDDGDFIRFYSRPPYFNNYSGPPREYFDPTNISLSAEVVINSLDEYILQRRQYMPNRGAEDVIVNQQEIGGWMVTAIHDYPGGYYSYPKFVVELDETKLLVFTRANSNNSILFFERLLSTLVINPE